MIELRWVGPRTLYKWDGTKENGIFTVPETKKSGIYLWTIPFEKKYLTYYVGETGRSFTERFMEYTRNYLCGLYRVYNPSEFVDGKKALVWGGMWKPDRKGPDTVQEFLNRYSELSTVIYKFLRQFRVFIAPLDVKKRVRQRIEAAIAERLLEQPGLTGRFQDNDIRYKPRRNNEERIRVKMKAFKLILGLCRELTA